MKQARPFLPFVLAFAGTLPGVYCRITHCYPSDPFQALISGLAILSASFLLLWACEAAQRDVSQSLALAAVALLAVAPEYMVDMYFTWQAGRYPDSSYSHYAIANMTGANRLLIGVGWAAVAALFWFKTRRPVELPHHRRTELLFLGMATLYAFVPPLKGSLAWYDGLVLLAIFAWYLVLAGKEGLVEYEAEGPAEVLACLPKVPRRLLTITFFLVAGSAIVANAEPFCEGLIATGKLWGINEFLLVQWLAPLASEAPEFLVAIMFAARLRAGMALGTLLSSKLNQWTLLVGMIPWVFALARGGFDRTLPLDGFQMEEVMLTAAQSLFAVMILASLRLTIWHAVVLFALFSGQLVAPGVVAALPRHEFLGFRPDQIHYVFSAIYVAAALGVFVSNPRAIWRLREGFRVHRLAPPEPPACPVPGEK